MDENGLRGVKQRQRFLDAAARLQQLLRLVTDADVEAEVAVLAEIVHNLLGKVVDVHHDAFVARGLQLLHDVPQQGLPPHPDERLGHRVGKRFQPGSQTSGKNHRLFHRQ